MPIQKWDYIAPTQGIFEPVADIAERIIKGELDIFVRPKTFGSLDSGVYLLVGDDTAYGVVEISEGRELTSPLDVKSLESEHGVTEKAIGDYSSVISSWLTGPWNAWKVSVLHRYPEPRAIKKSGVTPISVQNILVFDGGKSYLIPGIDIEDGELSLVQKIKDVDNYDPSKIQDAQLRDDFRICLAWYSTWKKDPGGFKYDEKQLAKLLESIVRELISRGPGVIQFDPSKMKPNAKEFFNTIARKVKVPKTMYKKLELSPKTNVRKFDVVDLIRAHYQSHKIFEVCKSEDSGWTTQDVVNLHANIVNKLADLGVEHPAPPDNGVDELSYDFEENAGESRVETAISKALEIVSATEPEETEKADLYASAPSESGSYRFVVHAHWRGKGVHNDLRYESKAGSGMLLGWTLNTAKPGAVSEPVTTLAAAKKYSNRGNAGKIFKINWATGEWDTKEGGGRVSILSEKKNPEPHPWIDVEGKTKDPEPGKPPPVGGTAQYPGVFDIIDQGTVEYGAQLPDFHELFLHGKVLKYRLIFHQATLRKDITLPSESGSAGFGWLCIYPEDQRPYVISTGAVKEGWMPDGANSALPAGIRDQIPEQYQYWKKGVDAKKIRDDLVSAIGKGDVKIDYEKPYGRKSSMQKAEFVLQTFHDKKDGSPCQWSVRIDAGGSDLFVIKSDKNPVSDSSIRVEISEERYGNSMLVNGRIPPGHYLNQGKRSDEYVLKIDGGEVEITSYSKNFIKAYFRGEQLNGWFSIVKNKEGWEWVRVTEPTEKSEDGFEVYVPFDYVEKQVSKEKRLVTGIVLEPNVIDAQYDFEKPEVIERAAHRFLAGYNKPSIQGGTTIGLMHQQFHNVGVELVESYIAHDDFYLGGNSTAKKVAKGSWVMTVHVFDDKTWKDVKDGKLTGFSVGGTIVSAGREV